MSEKSDEPQTVEEWLIAEGAVESVEYDPHTGEPYLVFTIPLKPLD